MFRHPRAPQTSGDRSFDSVGRSIVLVFLLDIVLISFSRDATLRGGEHITDTSNGETPLLRECETPNCRALSMTYSCSSDGRLDTRQDVQDVRRRLVRVSYCIVISSLPSSTGVILVHHFLEQFIVRLSAAFATTKLFARPPRARHASFRCSVHMTFYVTFRDVKSVV